MNQDNQNKIHLSLRHVTKTYQMNYGEITPLKSVSFDIYSGESLSIMGPSGSGKSTLLNILGCLDRPSSGEYKFLGESIQDLDDIKLSQIRAEQIGFIFQSFNLIPHLTVYENLAVGFQYLRDSRDSIGFKYSQDVRDSRGSNIEHKTNNTNDFHTSRTGVDTAIQKALDLVNLSHRLNHHPNELSGGEMQRVAIARAIAKGPSVILADEPTGNLDTVNSVGVIDVLKEINRQGVTLVVITHDPKVGDQFSRKIKMLDGEVCGGF